MRTSEPIDAPGGSGTQPSISPPPRARRAQRAPSTALLDRLRRQVVLAGGAREEIEVIAPFSGQPIASVPRGTEADVELAVGRARAAQREWLRTPIRQRAAIFERFHDLVLEKRGEILDLIQLESGKARRHALEEVLDTAVVAGYYATRAERLLRTRRRRGAFPVVTWTKEYRRPVGVVGVISPWNYPLNLAVTDAIPALLAGNAVVLKPDHQTPYTALWAVDLLYEAGLPPDVCPVVTGEGPELGPALISRIDYLMFTGSTRTGRIVATQAAERLIGCSLELGGKNPLIVLDDADLESAVDGAIRGCFVGAGQVCVSLERVYVPRVMYDGFVELFVRRAGELRLGPELDEAVDMGSLASERQLRTVREHLEDAVSKGARVLGGGRHRPDIGPYFLEPTILEGVAPGMLAYDQETFGPVVAVYPYDSIEEVVMRANDTIYGLNAAVWGKDLRRATRVARALDVGMANVNEAYAAAWASVDAEIGGMKQSGLRRRHGRDGLLKYTETQTVAVQPWFSIAPVPGIPASRYGDVLSGALRLMRRVPGLR